MANERLKTSAFGSMPVEAQVDINCKPSIGNERTKYISGDVLGVTNFNANLMHLRPGHGFSQGRPPKQHKSINILKDEVGLITEEGEQNLCSDPSAGFPLGGMIGYLMGHGSQVMVDHLDADDRTTGDGVEYFDIDLQAQFAPERGYLFVQKDSTPFQHS